MRLAHLPLTITPSRLRAMTRDYEARTESQRLDDAARSETLEALKVSVRANIGFNDWINALDELSEFKRLVLMQALAADDDKAVVRIVRAAFDACVLLDATDLANRLDAEARS